MKEHLNYRVLHIYKKIKLLKFLSHALGGVSALVRNCVFFRKSASKTYCYSDQTIKSKAPSYSGPTSTPAAAPCKNTAFKISHPDQAAERPAGDMINELFEAQKHKHWQ